MKFEHSGISANWDLFLVVAAFATGTAFVITKLRKWKVVKAAIYESWLAFAVVALFTLAVLLWNALHG